MNWENVLDEIQSPQFDSALNVVSSTNGFFYEVGKHPTVREAYRQMHDSGEVREDAIGRIYNLSRREIDFRYENPHDTALAVLLWLMNHVANDSVEVAATYVDEAPQCWYAKKLAQRILHPPPSSTRNFKLSSELYLTKSTSGSAQIPSMTEQPVESNRKNPWKGSTVPETRWATAEQV